VRDRRVSVRVFIRLGVGSEHVAQFQEGFKAGRYTSVQFDDFDGYSRILYCVMCPRFGCTPEVGSMKRPRGKGTGPRGVIGVGITERVGIARNECVSVRSLSPFPVEGGAGKKCVCVGVRRQVACMTGARIDWIRSWQRNASRPFSLAMRTNSICYLSGGRLFVASFDCLRAGTKCMCSYGIYRRVDMLPCPLTAAESYGVSSHTGSIKTTIKGVLYARRKRVRVGLL